MPHLSHLSVLAGRKGGSLKAYIGSLSRSDEVEQNADMRRCNFCFEAISGLQSGSHICGDKAKVMENLKNALTPKTQLALPILKDRVEEEDESVIQLQSHKGGKPTEVTAGKQF